MNRRGLCKIDDCTLPLMEGSTRYCYWHRLMRTSLDAQVREAGRRLARVTGAEGYVPRGRVPAAQWLEGTRWCAGCQTFVPLFYVGAGASRCRACITKTAREQHRLRTYGLKPETWDEIMAEQGHRCAVCRKRQTDRSLAAEHDHKTGVVRGGGCKRCNHDLLGAAYDSPRMTLAATVYLIAPPTSGLWLKPEDHGDELMATLREKIIEINERIGRDASVLEVEAT